MRCFWGCSRGPAGGAGERTTPTTLIAEGEADDDNAAAAVIRCLSSVVRIVFSGLELISGLAKPVKTTTNNQNDARLRMRMPYSREANFHSRPTDEVEKLRGNNAGQLARGEDRQYVCRHLGGILAGVGVRFLAS